MIQLYYAIDNMGYFAYDDTQCNSKNVLFYYDDFFRHDDFGLLILPLFLHEDAFSFVSFESVCADAAKHILNDDSVFSDAEKSRVAGIVLANSYLDAEYMSGYQVPDLAYSYVMDGLYDDFVETVESIIINYDTSSHSLGDFCKCASMLAYYFYTRYDDDNTIRIINTTFDIWKTSMARLNIDENPNRFLDMHSDVIALHIMIIILHKSGIVSGRIPMFFGGVSSWPGSIFANISDDKWWVCMKKIGVGIGMRCFIFDDSRLCRVTVS
jgi:hypothetical protein